MPEVITIAKLINDKIVLLEKMRPEIKKRGDAKADAIANYDKALAITLIKLHNGVEMELDGEKIKDIPASTSEKIAKGIVWEKRLELEKAEASYKSLISNIDSVQAELNAAQSLNRHLDKT